ncbi:MAG: peptidase [Flavisolibacter sp.]|nr:peptidase [Flavisolibacter sp.]
MKQKLTGLLSLLLLTSTAFSQAKLVEKVTKKGSELVIPYEKYVLPNGLTLILHEDHSDPVVHVDVTYHVGSAREEIGKSGFAHFFEHMMFQGSDNVGDEQHFKIITEAGGTLNGTTNRDRTNYFETVPSNQVEKMLWLEADRMGFLLDAVTQKKFEVQRSTVKNERGQSYDNAPYGLASENVSRNLYPYGHPYSWMTIGYLEDLDRSNAADLKNFFLRWYGPNNATLTIGGDIIPAVVVKQVEKYFGSMPKGPEVKAAQFSPVQITANRYTSYVDNYAKSPMLTVVYPTVPDYHKDMAALDVLAEVLGQGKTSILYQNLVKKQLALQASAFSSLSELAGEFSFRIMPQQGKSLAEMEALLQASLDSFEKRGVTDDDMAKFKGQIESSLIGQLQSVRGKVSTLAEFQTFTGNPNKMADILKAYTSVTKEDVMAVYNKYIKGKGAVVLSVLPKGKETLITKADNFKIDSSNYAAPEYGYAGLKYVKAKDIFDRKKMPGNTALPVVTVPKFWRKDLPNGIKAIGTENTEIPMVAISITMPGGHLAASKDLSKAGLASMFSQMMNEDTKKHTAEQIAIELEKLGSSLNISSGLDGVTYSVQSLKKNVDKTLALLQERIFEPAFNSDDFDRIKKQLLEGLKLAKARPAFVASAVFAKVNYGPNHILGISPSGTEQTVANITLDDVKGYYTNYLTSQDTKVIIAGDVKEAEVLAKLTFLSKLPNKKVVLPKVDAQPTVDKTKVYLVDVPKAAQTEFRVGYPTGIKYDATGEYYKNYLMNFALGGGFNSRLNLNLREDKGWTYGASSGFSGNKYAGDFAFSSGIRANATDSALSEIMREMAEYVASGPTEDEVSFMKKAVSQREALAYESLGQKSAFISRILEYNLPANYTAQQNKILQGMTVAELKKQAIKNLDPKKLNILVVGDKQKILEGVRKLGYDIVELDADGNLAGKQAF